MKKIIFAVVVFLSLEALAEDAPEKFKNPIFNDMLYSGGNKSFAHDIRVRPTGIKDYDNEAQDYECVYLAEDEKGFLLKCDNTKLLEGDLIQRYKMFYARYQTDFTESGGGKYCDVWNCDFVVEKGKIIGLGANAPVSHVSRVDNCAGEKDIWKDFGHGGPKMNCLDELKARGWEKYIPGKWEKKINTWQ